MYVFLDGELKRAVEWTFEAEINYLWSRAASVGVTAILLQPKCLNQRRRTYKKWCNMPAWLSTLASIGMAVGPPLVRISPGTRGPSNTWFIFQVYADQAISIIRKKRVNSAQFISMFYWIATVYCIGTQQAFLGTSVPSCKRSFAVATRLSPWRTPHFRLIANITRCFFWLGVGSFLFLLGTF